MVKSLVQLHQGTIEVTSELQKGTSVIVKLPLRKPSPDVVPTSGVLGARESDASILGGNYILNGKAFTLFGFKDSPARLIRDSLRQYLTAWFDMREAAGNVEPSLVLVGEDDLYECLSSTAKYRQKVKLIVVGDHTRQQSLLQIYPQSDILTTPFGPSKLLKILLAAFEPSQSSHITNGASYRNENARIDEDQKSPLSMMHESTSLKQTENFLPTDEGLEQILRNPEIIRRPSTLCNLEAVTRHTEQVTLSPQRQPRILCVDDNTINLRLLKTYMDKLGFKDVTCAENGSEAFEKARRRVEGFDIIFMGTPALTYPHHFHTLDISLTFPFSTDLSMPICDGFQCTSLIRNLEQMQLQITAPGTVPPTPATIIALTGLASQRDQDAAKEVGMDHFLTKPLKLSRLRELLVEWGYIVDVTSET